jgi:Ribbon-helix-helix protein, copG family
MKRTQLYLDEEMAKTLAKLSRQKGTTISELVRESLHEKYMTVRADGKAALARQLSGIWAKRSDLAKIGQVIRALRKGGRRKRFGLE